MENNNKEMKQALAAMGLLRALLNQSRNSEESEVVEKSHKIAKEKPNLQLVVTNLDEGKDERVINGSTVMALVLTETEVEGQAVLQGSTVIQGAFGMEEYAAALEMIDSLKNKLIENMIEHNLKKLEG